MNFTLDEITQGQDRLRQEIMERQCLLAAFDVMHGYMSKDHSPGTLELGSLVSALSPALPVAALSGESAVGAPAAPAVLPMPAIEPPYVHPELKAIGDRFGSNVQIVRWAIARMTEDYSLMDIRALLRREGRPLRAAKISVVLTRMRASGEIEEIERSRGPIPARFRGPASATAEETKSAEQIQDTESAAASAAVA